MSEAMIVRRGSSKKLQTKTVTPSTSQQSVTPDSGYDGLDKVTVNAITPTKAAQTYTPGTSDQTIASGRWLTGAQTIKGDENLVAENIKEGISIFGVTGIHKDALSTDNALLHVQVYSSSGYGGYVNVSGNGYYESSLSSFAQISGTSRISHYFFQIPRANLGLLTVTGGTTSASVRVTYAGYYYTATLST